MLNIYSFENNCLSFCDIVLIVEIQILRKNSRENIYLHSGIVIQWTNLPDGRLEYAF